MGAGARKHRDAREHYRELYREIFPGGERLNELKGIVDWEAFRPVLENNFAYRSPSTSSRVNARV
ncbi:MAG TPA: hypothetical protein ENO38_03725 [Nitrososphaeria archaeon]|jgi:hypothetical protein|nr:hypothetical protein [Conexivisphaerales archaeon]PMP97659.1 MAG: hypothetical protein C0167_00520 [Nitrososphaera sp.]HEU16763.1 hypothetical protein [Nitrososphaeria archaeon]